MDFPKSMAFLDAGDQIPRIKAPYWGGDRTRFASIVKKGTGKITAGVPCITFKESPDLDSCQASRSCVVVIPCPSPIPAPALPFAPILALQMVAYVVGKLWGWLGPTMSQCTSSFGQEPVSSPV